MADEIVIGKLLRLHLDAVTVTDAEAFEEVAETENGGLRFGWVTLQFADFLKVGGPLTILYWILATFLIPRFFPF